MEGSGSGWFPSGFCKKFKEEKMAIGIQQVFNEALFALNSRNLQKAEEGFRRVLNLDSSHVPSLNLLTVVLMSLGRFSDAEPFIARAVKLNKNSDVSFYNYGLIAKNLNKSQLALEQFTKALTLNGSVPETWNNRGTVYNDLKQYELAIADFDRAVRINPNYAEGYTNRGKSLGLLKRYDEALAAYDRALSIKADLEDAWIGRGNVFTELKRHDEACAAYDKALSIRLDLAEAWLGRGNCCKNLKRYDEAFAAYDRALSIKPELAEAWLGRGNIFTDLNRYEQASAAYDKALAINLDLAEAWLGRGNVFTELKRQDEAFAAYDKALSIKPDLAEAWLGRGNCCKDLKRYDEAFSAYDRGLSIKPDLESVEGARLHSKMHLCNWNNFDAEVAHLAASIKSNKPVSSPFALLSLSDGSEEQLKCAQAWIGAKVLSPEKPALQGKLPEHDKIRVGFVSADFLTHPVGYLTAGLFGLHDRARFEMYAFSVGPNDYSETRRRLQKSFYKFFDLYNASDDEIISAIESSEIDILIDLNGHTAGGRTSVFARRPAPIVVNYLGYAGSMGADFYDYILVDKVIVPEGHFVFFSERLVYLPHCFMPHDEEGRKILKAVSSRSEHGLPDDGFVFCCFNNPYKLNPDVFASWMRILSAVNNSVLWLSDMNIKAKENLEKEAAKYSIDSNKRFVFAPRLESSSDHLTRHRLADLFLDTLPYNAHTTASDALWTGLPIVTQIGSAFAGRVAASLLKAVGLPELITHSAEEYESLAIELAINPMKLKAIKEKLARNRLTTPLFDTPLLVKHLEAAYDAMHRRYRADLPPDHIEIPARSLESGSGEN